MISSKHKAYILLISVLCSAFLIGGVSIGIAVQARAVLYYPRLGVPACTGNSDGSSDPTLLDGGFTVVVGVDPQEVNVPSDWKAKENWNVAISPSVIDNASLITLEVSSIRTISNPYSNLGLEDTSLLTRNAVELTVKVGSQIAPCLYDLYIGYKTAISRESLGGYIETEEGEFMGSRGSGSWRSDEFVLTEPNAVYVPSTQDSMPSSSQSQIAPAIDKDPWSLLQITDVHTATGSSGDWSNLIQMDNLAQALSIWAPDIIIGTGDITNSPDDHEIEYRRAYNYFKTLGLPVLLDNGNHDQGNLGLWPYYFGPTHAVVNWMDTYFIQFNSAAQMTTRTTSWITSNIRQYAGDYPLFLCCHIPLYDVRGRQISGYSGGIIDAMIQNGVTASLHGHNHYDMVMDADTALALYLDPVKTTKTITEMEMFTDACHVPSQVGTVAPEGDGTKIIITTSAAKGQREYRLHEYDIWPDYEGTMGYRRITVAGNKMINYTYDNDGDGQRDPSYSTPLWKLNGSLEFNEADLNQGANFTISNGLTEPISSARAAFLLPSSAGQNWMPTSTMSSYSYYERNRISNGTHTFIEYRVFVDKRVGPSIPYELKFEMELV